MYSQNIEQYLELPDDMLLEMIGDDVLQQQAFAMEPSHQQKKFEGTSWLEHNRMLLQERICKATIVTQYLKEPSVNDRVTLIAAIADLVIRMLHGVAAVSVAILIVREGLHTFCHAMK